MHSDRVSFFSHFELLRAAGAASLGEVMLLLFVCKLCSTKDITQNETTSTICYDLLEIFCSDFALAPMVPN